MHVFEFLHPLGFGPDYEVVEARHPDVSGVRRFPPQAAMRRRLFAALSEQTSREALFQYLHDSRRISTLRFADQQMEMCGHDDVTDDHEVVAAANLFESLQEQAADVGGADNSCR